MVAAMAIIAVTIGQYHFLFGWTSILYFLNMLDIVVIGFVFASLAMLQGVIGSILSIHYQNLTFKSRNVGIPV